jgi:hypothetical protein
MMEESVSEYRTLKNTTPCVAALENLIGRYKVPSGNKFTTHVNQRVTCISLPTTAIRNTEQALFQTDSQTPIDAFYDHMQKCWINGVVLNIDEKQDACEPIRHIRDAPVLSGTDAVPDILDRAVQGIHDDDDELPDLPEDTISASSTGPVTPGSRIHRLTPEEMKLPYTPEQLREFPRNTHSGVWLDFDIYQRESTRKIDDEQFHSLVQNVCILLRKMLEFRCANPTGILASGTGGLGQVLTVYAIILRKKAPRLIPNHAKYGRCYKESFHLRIPTTLITRGCKVWLIEQVVKSTWIRDLFSGITLLNPIEDVVDRGVLSNSPMLLGCCKVGSSEPHQIARVYRVAIRSGEDVPRLEDVTQSEFGSQDQLPELATPKSRSKKATPVRPTYLYNLVYECSLVYENPNGLIKKRRFEARSTLSGEIRTITERVGEGILTRADVSGVDAAVQDLITRDHDAAYMYKVLGVLHEGRADDYAQWRSIIFILARRCRDWKPLAYWFSQRNARKWADPESRPALDKMWDWALSNPHQVDPHQTVRYDQEEMNKRDTRTLEAWARQDNPAEFERIQHENASTLLMTICQETQGHPNETQVCKVLQLIYGLRFVTDYEVSKHVKQRIWYCFIFPTDRAPTGRHVYKWKVEHDYPDALDHYLYTQFAEYVEQIKNYFMTCKEPRAGQPPIGEDRIKQYSLIVNNLTKFKHNLGNQMTISKYIRRSAIIFQKDGFREALDMCEHAMGTTNGILILRPKTELVQSYNEYRVSRSATCPYVPWGKTIGNPYTTAIQFTIEELFAGEHDAMELCMCYLASSIDFHKKSPLFFIWLGGGANGKSYLLELHTKMLGAVQKDGYACKINSAFFTSQAKHTGDADSQMMQLQWARFSYSSETKLGDKLFMDRIKEFTSDTVSARELYGQQANFDINARFVLASNHELRVEGSDHGTWRRLLVYNFQMQYVDNPDPKNPRQRKLNSECIELWPKDQRYKEAYFSYIVHWYEIYREKYKRNLKRIPCPTIMKQTLDYRCRQDLMSRFVRAMVEYVGPRYIDESVTPPVIVNTPVLKLSEVSERYMQWHAAEISRKDVPFGNDIITQLAQFGSLKEYVKNVDAGNGSPSGQYLMDHIIHEVNETWSATPRPPPTKEEIAREEQALMGPKGDCTYLGPELTHASVITGKGGSVSDGVPESLMDELALAARSEFRMADVDPETFPTAHDDEVEEYAHLKTFFPDFNTDAVNESIMKDLSRGDPNKKKIREYLQYKRAVERGDDTELGDGNLPDDVNPYEGLPSMRADAEPMLNSLRSRMVIIGDIDEEPPMPDPLSIPLARAADNIADEVVDDSGFVMLGPGGVAERDSDDDSVTEDDLTGINTYPTHTPRTPTRQTPTRPTPTRQIPTRQIPTRQIPTRQIPTRQIPTHTSGRGAGRGMGLSSRISHKK